MSEPLIGRVTVSIDSKWRLWLGRRFLSRIGEEAVLFTSRSGKTLEIYPRSRLDALLSSGFEPENVFDVPLDRQGRALVPKSLRDIELFRCLSPD
ncbi:MAG: hypothetical protein KGL39_20865, partial [Patescibacteria group bacterium]|nr:hypothetical protein [Patescibacteria group bacterium]